MITAQRGGQANANADREQRAVQVQDFVLDGKVITNAVEYADVRLV